MFRTTRVFQIRRYFTLLVINHPYIYWSYIWLIIIIIFNIHEYDKIFLLPKPVSFPLFLATNRGRVEFIETGRQDKTVELCHRCVMGQSASSILLHHEESLPSFTVVKGECFLILDWDLPDLSWRGRTYWLVIIDRKARPESVVLFFRDWCQEFSIVVIIQNCKLVLHRCC